MLNIAAAKTALCPGLVVARRKSQLFGENKQGADVREAQGGREEREDSAKSQLLLRGICLTSAFQTGCIESAFFSTDILSFAQ